MNKKKMTMVRKQKASNPLRRKGKEINGKKGLSHKTFVSHWSQPTNKRRTKGWNGSLYRTEQMKWKRTKSCLSLRKFSTVIEKEDHVTMRKQLLDNLFFILIVTKKDKSTRITTGTLISSSESRTSISSVMKPAEGWGTVCELHLFW